MDEFNSNLSSVMFCLCSPQYIATNTFFREALLRAHGRRVLRLVVVDEAHLYAAHGRSFREKIRVLKQVFFLKIYLAGGGFTVLYS